MQEIIIQCPNCKTEIPVFEVPGSQIRTQIEADLHNEHQQQQLLLRPGRAMERQWNERDKQIDRVVTSMAGMYGEMSVILGGALPVIPALELEAELLESDVD